MIDAESRLLRLEAKDRIARLSSDYCRYCDTRQLPELIALFAADADVAIPAFGVHCRGQAEIENAYAAQFAGLGFSNHWSHDMAVDFAGDEQASGRVTAHAEVVIDGVTCLAAMHYEDVYTKLSGHWLIQSRVVNFIFYSPLAELADRLLTSATVRTPSGWVPGYRSAQRSD